MESMACAGIEHLDQRNPQIKLTLQEMVVSLPDFVNIDLNWRGDLFSIIFPKKYKETARNKIAHLGAYLHKCYGGNILPSLPAEAQEIIANTTWDDSGCPGFQLDQELDDILAADGVIGYVDLSLLKEDKLARPSSTPAISNTFLPQLDEHSISTFRDNPATTIVNQSKSDSGQTSKNAFSTVSNVTMDSHVSEMEFNFYNMKYLFQQIYDGDAKEGGLIKPSVSKSTTTASTSTDAAAKV